MDDFGPLIWIVVSIIAFLFNKLKNNAEENASNDSWVEEWEDDDDMATSHNTPTHIDQKIQANQDYKAWRQEQENLEKAQRHQDLLSERDALRAQQIAEDEHEHKSLNVMANAKLEEARIKLQGEITDQEISNIPHLPLHQLRLHEKEELRRAILLKNILDKPKALL